MKGIMEKWEEERAVPTSLACFRGLKLRFSPIRAVVSVHINKLSRTGLLQKNQTGSEESTQREPLFTLTSLNADVSYSEQGWW